MATILMEHPAQKWQANVIVSLLTLLVGAAGLGTRAAVSMSEDVSSMETRMAVIEHRLLTDDKDEHTRQINALKIHFAEMEEAMRAMHPNYHAGRGRYGRED